jgi:sugar transferase (PEP-CTERM/EpsH1 system associated)
VLKPVAEIDLVSFVHDDDEARHTGEMKSLVSSVTAVRLPSWKNHVRAAAALPTARTLTHVLLDADELRTRLAELVSTRTPDIVLTYCSGMAQFALSQPLDRFPFVLDMVDVDSAKWGSLGEGARVPMGWVYRREARLLAGFEQSAARRAFSTVVVNEREREALLRLAPGARVDVIGNGVDVESLRPRNPPAHDPTVVFCGVMNYAPNEEAAVWLAREVWPLVRKGRPEAKLLLVGSAPSRSVRQLGDEPGITVTGHVDDVRPYLWGAAVAAAPLRVARGVQNKVLEAAAAGLPVVITPAVAEGLPTSVLAACDIADSARAFADALALQLNRTPEDRRRRAAAANLESLSWEARLAPFRGLLQQAAQQPEPALL